jgi:hypothetical protein
MGPYTHSTPQCGLGEKEDREETAKSIKLVSTKRRISRTESKPVKLHEIEISQ